MRFDYSKLKQIMKRERYNITSLSKAIGISRVRLSYILNNHAYFSQSQLKDIISVLNISTRDINKCFFTLKVLKSEQK